MTEQRPIHVCNDCLARLVPAKGHEDCEVERHIKPLRGEDYPALAKVWENDEDDDEPVR